MKSLTDGRCYKGFTDGVDCNFEITLFEYGIIRNPKTGETVFCHNTYDEPETLEDAKLSCDIITLDDVRDNLQDQSDGYFSFIGSDKKTELDQLDNDDLAHTIFSINQYDGTLQSSYYEY